MKIDFVWSFIYEEQMHLPEGSFYDRNKAEKEVLEFIKLLRKDWKPIEKDVLLYIEKVSGLKWKKEELKCYVVSLSKHMPISDPLTISIKFKAGEEIFELTKERFLDMMIHELIHNLFIQNSNVLTSYFKNLINGKYGSTNWNTAIHIPLHAIHEKVFLKFFSKERFDEELESCSYYPEYKESWEIVMKEKSDKILEDMRRSII